jgi:polar amino acid transport system permease protein
MAQDLFYGISVTVSLFLWAWLIGMPVALLIAVSAFLRPSARILVKAFAIFFTVTPLLAILFWLHYPAQSTLDIVVPPYNTAVLVLTLFVIAGVSDILLVSMIETNIRYRDAIKVLGVRWGRYLRKVLLPVSVVTSLPRLLTLAIVTIHATMFTSLIGVEELFRVTQRLNSLYLKPVELFSVMAFGYLVICLPLYALARYLEQHSIINHEHTARA